MRLVIWLLMGSGAVLCLVTFAGWVWLNAFACGCTDIRLRWEDTEALSLFIPPFVTGCMLMIGGGALWIGERSARR